MKKSVIALLVICLLLVIAISYYLGVENGRKMVAAQLADSTMSYIMCLGNLERGRADQAKDLIEQRYLSNALMSLQYLRLNYLTPFYRKIPGIIVFSFSCPKFDDSLAWDILTYKKHIDQKKNRNAAEENMLKLLNMDDIDRLLTNLNKSSNISLQRTVPGVR